MMTCVRNILWGLFGGVVLGTLIGALVELWQFTLAMIVLFVIAYSFERIFFKKSASGVWIERPNRGDPGSPLNWES